ncbi:MAG: DNA/RNA nuclease SfsA [Eubacteriales bacterium]|nr:DNA/RNA nuclease SfsA [Eubacteriales bacterium]
MKYNNVVGGKFLSRPNRFIAKVEIDGKEETVHVKNTGRCRELLIPGAEIWLEHSDNPDRKTSYDLFAVYKEGLGLINMDSQAPNKVVREWMEGKQKPHVRIEKGYCLPENVTMVKPEYTFGKSRIDFYFECEDQQGNIKKCLMEVKGVTLEKEGIACFPDAPTERGIKHIRELEGALEEGYECFLAFVIQMPEILDIRPNDETHPAFGEALRRAHKKGIKILSLGCHMEKDEIHICSGKVIDELC